MFEFLRGVHDPLSYFEKTNIALQRQIKETTWFAIDRTTGAPLKVLLHRPRTDLPVLEHSAPPSVVYETATLSYQVLPWIHGIPLSVAITHQRLHTYYTHYRNTLASVLNAIHAQGWIHCDVKPENCIVHGPNLTLIDWEHATPCHQHVFATTPSYTPPEYYQNAPLAADPTFDVYQWGLVAKELHHNKRFSTAPVNHPDIEKALDPNPKARPVPLPIEPCPRESTPPTPPFPCATLCVDRLITHCYHDDQWLCYFGAPKEGTPAILFKQCEQEASTSFYWDGNRLHTSGPLRSVWSHDKHLCVLLGSTCPGYTYPLSPSTPQSWLAHRFLEDGPKTLCGAIFPQD